jgi:TPR repeat protein
MSIGLTKKGDMTDYEWYSLLAENGHRSYQYRLAIEINSNSLKSDRLVQSYKWLCLSALLGEAGAKEIAQFLYIGMSAEEIFLADKLVEEWIEEKFDSVELKDTSGWSKELRQFINHSA